MAGLRLSMVVDLGSGHIVLDGIEVVHKCGIAVQYDTLGRYLTC